MQSNKRVTISCGNRKLGAIMNVSTEPVLCCPKGIPCAEGGCYALNFELATCVAASTPHASPSFIGDCGFGIASSTMMFLACG
jgi:hypothetical protein